MTFIHIYLILVYTAIGGIHMYWAFGGKRGGVAAIPVNENGPVFEPGIGPTIVVALIFFTGVLAVVFDAKEIRFIFLQDYLFHVIAFVFAARAIGEFRYVGIFKKVKGTVYFYFWCVRCGD